MNVTLPEAIRQPAERIETMTRAELGATIQDLTALVVNARSEAERGFAELLLDCATARINGEGAVATAERQFAHLVRLRDARVRTEATHVARRSPACGRWPRRR